MDSFHVGHSVTLAPLIPDYLSVSGRKALHKLFAIEACLTKCLHKIEPFIPSINKFVTV
jgi:hypothetical protein